MGEEEMGFARLLSPRIGKWTGMSTPEWHVIKADFVEI